MKGLNPSRFEVSVTFDELSVRQGRAKRCEVAQRESIRRRLMMCGLGLASVFGLLGVRTTQLALDTPDPIYRMATSNEAGGPSRIEDDEGRALAVTLKGYGLAVDGTEVWDAFETVQSLAGVFPDIDVERGLQLLQERRRWTGKRVITANERQAGRSLGLTGFLFPEADIRAYPQGRLFSHVVGYQIDGRGGVTGLEAAMSARELSGPQTTTLDVAAQTILLSELARAQATYDAKAAWGVLMNARTGDVAAMVSLPDFDPNVPGRSPAGARRNRTVSDNYELGSAFKPLTVAMAMEEGFGSLKTPVDVTSPLQVGEWAIDDYSEKGSVMSFEEIVAYSSNIGTAQLALLMGEQRFVQTLETLGLTERMVTSLPESRSPALPETWGEAELATVSYGHGIAVSPLHLTASFAALVNGGTRINPRFLTDDPVEAEPVFSSSTSRAMRRALRSVVTYGTGKKAEAPGYYVIGKTATADKPGVGGYRDDGPLISSFIGAFPGHDPEWVLLVSLDEPQGIPETYGFATAGFNAAPTFRRVVERVAPILGVMPVRDDEAADAFVSVLDERARLDLPPTRVVVGSDSR